MLTQTTLKCASIVALVLVVLSCVDGQSECDCDKLDHNPANDESVEEEPKSSSATTKDGLVENNDADENTEEERPVWLQPWDAWPSLGAPLPYNRTIGNSPRFDKLVREPDMGPPIESNAIFDNGQANQSEEIYRLAEYLLPSLFEYDVSREEKEFLARDMAAALEPVAKDFRGCFVYSFSNPMFSLLIRNEAGYNFDSLEPVYRDKSIPSRWTYSSLSILNDPYPYKILDPTPYRESEVLLPNDEEQEEEEGHKGGQSSGYSPSLAISYLSNASFLCGGVHNLPVSGWKVVDADHGPVLTIHGLESDYIETVWRAKGAAWAEDVVDVIIKTDGMGELYAIRSDGVRISGQLVWQINDTYRQDSSWGGPEERGPIVVDWIEIQGDNLVKFRPPEWTYLPKN